MPTRDNNDKDLHLQPNEPDPVDLVNDEVDKKENTAATQMQNNDSANNKKSSQETEKRQNNVSLNVESNALPDKAHVVVDGASIKGIEALLNDLILERKKLRRKGWFTRLVLMAAVIILVFMTFFKPADMVDATDHTALVKMRGIIMPDGDIDSDLVLSSLTSAFKNKHSKGVVIQLNSPGGSPVQSQEIYDGILRLKSQYNKPVVVVIGDVGASGGYYIAAAADSIYASRASIVGSIGVRMDSFGVTDLMEKIGVESRTLTAGKYKAALDPFSPTNPEVEAHLQKMIDGVHQQFINAVEQGRGGRLKGNKSDIYSGLFWNGQQSFELGLIDGFKSLSQVASEDMGASKVIDYTIEPDYLSLFAKNIGVSMANRFYQLFSETTIK